MPYHLDLLNQSSPIIATLVQDIYIVEEQFNYHLKQ
jgi:hypothetical protein